MNYILLSLNIKVFLNLNINYLILLIPKNKKRESAEIKIIEAPEAMS